MQGWWDTHLFCKLQVWLEIVHLLSDTWWHHHYHHPVALGKTANLSESQCCYLKETSIFTITTGLSGLESCKPTLSEMLGLELTPDASISGIHYGMCVTMLDISEYCRELRPVGAC